MKYNIFLYGAAAFLLFRYIKKRQDAAAADVFNIKPGTGTAKTQELTTQQQRSTF
jgi:hypothetical protein